MAKERETRHVRPRDDEELKAIETRLVDLAKKFRDIRMEMKDAGLASLMLATGTFTHFLDRLEPLAERYEGEFRAQKREHEIKASVQKVRDEIKSGVRKVGRAKL